MMLREDGMSVSTHEHGSVPRLLIRMLGVRRSMGDKEERKRG